MNSKNLEKAINDSTDVLRSVVNAAYQLKPIEKMDLVEIAHQTNKKLGYELFNDLYYPRLVNDFSIVARAVQQHALLSE